MSYLLDKKLKRKKFFNIILGILTFIVLFYFRTNLWNGFSFVTHLVFRPVLVLGNGIGEKFNNIEAYFTSKSSLLAEDQTMRIQLSEEESRMANYDTIFAENENLKGILGRKDTKTTMTLAAILSKPSKSPYDTIIIDAGTAQGIKSESTVFALGNIPIGRVAEVYPSSSKVILFSNSDERTQVIISNKTNSSNQPSDVFMELVGRGGGNFEMTIPRDFVLKKGDQATMPGINPYVVAVAETTISDPRDPFTKALFRSPVNVQDLKFVEIEQ